MQITSPPPAFHPNGPDTAGIISWVHLGDLHLVEAGARNHRDLLALVTQLNAAFQHHTSFVYLPGDNADNGSTAAYSAARQALDQLALPWCAIVGDHDVHEKSHANFLSAFSRELHYSFTVGDIRFLALNAFDIPEPPSFSILAPQLAWLRQQLRDASSERTVLLLHCYPADLKQGRDELQSLVREYRPLLIDMGHTHYNEIANDGHTLYTATRSTGQIEEGPVGFSVTCIDGSAISWRFFPLGPDPAHPAPCVLITSPSDARLRTTHTPFESGTLRAPLRAKVWSAHPVTSVSAILDDGPALPMHPVQDSNTWELSPDTPLCVTNTVTVTAITTSGQIATDTIHLQHEPQPSRSLHENPPRSNHEDRYALAPWPEHGLLGTQLGPNKNGRKW